MSASIRKLCGQAALIAAIIVGGLFMGALTPAYSSDAARTSSSAGALTAP